MRIILIAPTTLIAAVFMLSCTPTTSLATTTLPAEIEADNSSASETIIEIKLFNFPDVVEVPVGTTVTWLNQDGTQHSVTNGTPEQDGQAEQLGGFFDSGFFVQGESISYTFTEPGDYPYFCMRHNHMQGIIRVLP